MEPCGRCRHGTLVFSIYRLVTRSIFRERCGGFTLDVRGEGNMTDEMELFLKRSFTVESQSKLSGMSFFYCGTQTGLKEYFRADSRGFGRLY